MSWVCLPSLLLSSCVLASILWVTSHSNSSRQKEAARDFTPLRVRLLGTSSFLYLSQSRTTAKYCGEVSRKSAPVEPTYRFIDVSENILLSVEPGTEQRLALVVVIKVPPTFSSIRSLLERVEELS